MERDTREMGRYVKALVEVCFVFVCDWCFW
jgi:hypothetical protein